jgi:hypothetical protein
MPSIFVSYRRTDAPAHAGRIYDRLVDRFGNANVYKDIDSTAPGADFAEVINQTIVRCDAVVAVIGRDWAPASRRGRQRRPFDDPQDWVRREIAAALERNIRVVPVLVEGAQIPSPDQLPDDVKPLTRRHAVELSETAWTPQLDRLIDALAMPSSMPPAGGSPTSPSERPHPPPREPAASRRLRTAGARRQTRQLVVAGASALIAIGAAVLAFSGGGSDKPNETMSREPGTAGARSVSLYRERVGDVCDAVNGAEKARARDDKGANIRVHRARTTIAQRNALLDAVRRSAARSAHARTSFAALRAPRADVAAHTETEAAWNRNAARLRTYAQRLDQAVTRPELVAALNYLSNVRPRLARDGDTVTAGLERLGAAECDLDPPTVTRGFTLPKPRGTRGGSKSPAIANVPSGSTTTDSPRHPSTTTTTTTPNGESPIANLPEPQGTPTASSPTTTETPP